MVSALHPHPPRLELWVPEPPHAEARPRVPAAGPLRWAGGAGGLGAPPRGDASALPAAAWMCGSGPLRRTALHLCAPLSLRVPLGLPSLSLPVSGSPVSGFRSLASSRARPGRGPRGVGRNAGLWPPLPALSRNRRGNRRPGRETRRAQIPGAAFLSRAPGPTQGKGRRRWEVPPPRHGEGRLTR